MQTAKLWLAAICTLAAFSFLLGDNPVYKFCEHFLVGLTAAHYLNEGYSSIIEKAWKPLVQKGEILWLGAIIGGLLLLLRWVPSMGWVSRSPLSFMMGVAAAVSCRRVITSEFLDQVVATAKLPWTSPNNIIFVLIVAFSMSYFIFGVSEKSRVGSILKRSSAIGQALMMIAFGAGLGATIMARLAQVVGRIQFLFTDWLKIGV